MIMAPGFNRLAELLKQHWTTVFALVAHTMCYKKMKMKSMKNPTLLFSCFKCQIIAFNQQRWEGALDRSAAWHAEAGGGSVLVLQLHAAVCH